MNIFSRNKTVVGLFSNEQDVEDAVKTLQQQGFAQEDDHKIRIIDEHRLLQETPITEEHKPLVGSSEGQAGPANVSDLVPEPDAAFENDTKMTLENIGLSGDEAAFYARQVARGGTLVMVETTKERVQEATDIMEQTQARFSVN